MITKTLYLTVENVHYFINEHFHTNISNFSISLYGFIDSETIYCLKIKIHEDWKDNFPKDLEKFTIIPTLPVYGNT